jgi:F-type H+-transporting ATPase subunit b
MLDISPMLLGSTIVVFLALIAVLNGLLYNPLFSYMEKRDTDIQRDLSEVGSNDTEIAGLEAKASKIVSDAKLEAAALREKVVADAKELAESKMEAKRTELAKAYEEFEASLEKEKEDLTNALLSQVPLFKEAVKAKMAQI